MAKKKTSKSRKTVTLKKKGQAPITFSAGKLHRALGVPEGKPIPAGKKAAALAGRYGPEVKRMATNAFKGFLAKGRKTAKSRKRRRK